MSTASQTPLKKGDAVFFSPALFHGAGANVASYDRLANLVQISSAMGRTMETIDFDVMTRAVYPILLQKLQQGAISDRMVETAIAAAADGYSFPTNLDSDPPSGGPPETAQELTRRALREKWPADQFNVALNDYAKRRRA